MSLIKQDCFSIDGYLWLIHSFRERGYQIVGYDEVKATSRHLILRHDVDFDLNAAIELAELETSAGLKSTYFVLVRTEFYNALSAGGARSLRRLVGLGHDVGLHFDGSLQAHDSGIVVEAITAELGILESTVGRPIKVFSFHRPDQRMLDLDIHIDDRINSSGARFFGEIGYCSDSRGAWNRGHPLESPAFTIGQAIQLLTHPIWWTSSRKATPQKKLEDFLTRRFRFLDSEIATNCGAYQRTTNDTR